MDQKGAKGTQGKDGGGAGQGADQDGEGEADGGYADGGQNQDPLSRDLSKEDFIRRLTEAKICKTHARGLDLFRNIWNHRG